MNDNVYKSVTPLYAVAVAWLLYALLFPLHTLWHYLIAVVVTAVVGFVARALCPDVQEAEDPVENKKEESRASENPALDAMVVDGKAAISEMRRLHAGIQDEKLRDQIVKLQQLTDKIMDYVQDNPDKLPQIRKFMNYYLPTTLKLLRSYDRMDDHDIRGENITATKAKVEGVMDTIVVAFEKQLDSLFGSEALDISTDITVLENMLAREGLSDDGMKQAVAEATNSAPAPAADIATEEAVVEAVTEQLSEEADNSVEAGGITLTL